MTRPTSSAYLQWMLTGAPAEILVFDAVVTEGWTLDATVTEHPVEIGPNVADHVRVSLAEVELSVIVSNEPFGRPQWGFGLTAPSLAPTTLKLPGANELGIQAGIFGTPTATGSITVPGWDNMLLERTAAKTIAGAAAGEITGLSAAVLAAGLLVDAELPPHATASVVAAPPGLPVPSSRTLTVQTYEFDGGNEDPIDFQSLTLNLLQFLKDSAQLITVFGTRNTRQNMVIVKLQPSFDNESTAMKLALGLKEIRLVQTSSVIAPKPTIPRAKAPTDKGPQDTKPPPAPIASRLVSQTGALVSGKAYTDGFGFGFTQ